VMWQPEHVTLFLDTAYNNFRWRSIGLIVHMSYEWGQRVGDMRTLKWESIKFDEKRMDLEQSKRGVDVHLPISDNLIKMLAQQKEDFDFQDYVAPRTEPKAGTYSHYTIDEIHILINEVKDEANLPKELQARDLRRTAITEMVEAGVDLVGIMQVSGHQSPQSVKPYLVNTYSGASNALERRFKNGDKH
jgi:integrase